MTTTESLAEPYAYATNKAETFQDEEEGLEEEEEEVEETGALSRAPGRYGSSCGLYNDDDSDEDDSNEDDSNEDDIFARDKADRDSLLEEEQESFARIKDGHTESRLLRKDYPNVSCFTNGPWFVQNEK